MFKSIFFILGAILVSSAFSENNTIRSSDIWIVSDADEFGKSNLGEGVRPLSKQINPRKLVEYSAGSRRYKDMLVSVNSDKRTYSSPQNISMTINYPESGIGAVVTYFVMTVAQGSSSGRAWIASGGIGQRHISIVIEAQNSKYMSYGVSIYGLQ